MQGFLDPRVYAIVVGAILGILVSTLQQSRRRRRPQRQRRGNRERVHHHGQRSPRRYTLIELRGGRR